MHYEINVSKHGSHFFATAPRSLTCKKAAAEMLGYFRNRFPVAEGFECQLYECATSKVEFDVDTSV
jgi:hypothetical protein